MSTFERFFLGLGAVCVLSALVRCVAGCGGDEFTQAESVGIEREAGGDDGARVQSDAGQGVDSQVADGMDRVLPPEGGKDGGADGAADAATVDGALDSAACDGGPLLCATDDPGPGVYCHNFGGSWCSILDAGACGNVGAACLTQAPDPQQGPCAGHVRCGP